MISWLLTFVLCFALYLYNTVTIISYSYLRTCFANPPKYIVSLLLCDGYIMDLAIQCCFTMAHSHAGVFWVLTGKFDKLATEQSIMFLH